MVCDHGKVSSLEVPMSCNGLECQARGRCYNPSLDPRQRPARNQLVASTTVFGAEGLGLRGAPQIGPNLRHDELQARLGSRRTSARSGA